MSVFHRIGKTAANLGRRTRDSFQSFSETTRLRSLLSGEEKYFTKLCREIGEQYVRLHSEDYTEDFNELMTLALESRNRTEGYRSQLNSLRRVRPCPNCGAEVPMDFAFCNFCGTKLPEVEIPVPKGFVKCPGCQAVIPAAMDFCNFCGCEQQVHLDKVAQAAEPPLLEGDLAEDTEAVSVQEDSPMPAFSEQEGEPEPVSSEQDQTPAL